MLKSNKKQTLTVYNKMELGEDISVEAKGKGRKFVSRFIEPGVAHYEEFGDVLITKETFNSFIHTMIGCPVIIQHKDIDDENADKERVGVISNVWFNEFDGWYYCDGIIWDKQAIDLIKNQGWSVSCTYDFDSDKLAKIHNGKKIDMEFTGGEFLHLALVPNPRYERANIVVNSKDESKNDNPNHDKDGKFAKVLKDAEDKLNKEETKETNKEKEVKIQDEPQKYAIIKELKDSQSKNSLTEKEITMSVLNELESFIKGVIKNANDEDKKEEVKNEDKRKLIDEVGGILKGKVDDEVIKTIMKKMEEASYEPSEDDKADNKAKNADEEEKEEKFEEEKKVADNKCKNEEEKKEEDKKEEDKDEDDEVDKEEVKNKCKNSMKDVKEIIMGGKSKVESDYISKADRFALGEKY